MTKVLESGQLEWILEATTEMLEEKFNELHDQYSHYLKLSDSKKCLELSGEIADVTLELSRRFRRF